MTRQYYIILDRVCQDHFEKIQDCIGSRKDEYINDVYDGFKEHLQGDNIYKLHSVICSIIVELLNYQKENSNFQLIQLRNRDQWSEYLSNQINAWIEKEKIPIKKRLCQVKERL